MKETVRDTSKGAQESTYVREKWRLGANAVIKELNEESVEVKERKLDRKLN